MNFEEWFDEKYPAASFFVRRVAKESWSEAQSSREGASCHVCGGETQSTGYFCLKCGATSKVESREDGIGDAQHETLLEACKVMCAGCRGESEHAKSDVVKIARKYVCNYGELEGWVHFGKYTEYWHCDAAPIRELIYSLTPAASHEKLLKEAAALLNFAAMGIADAQGKFGGGNAQPSKNWWARVEKFNAAYADSLPRVEERCPTCKSPRPELNGGWELCNDSWHGGSLAPAAELKTEKEQL